MESNRRLTPGIDITQSAGILFALLFFSIVIVCTAWIADDSFVTFRTVWNFLHGYGLLWNVSERVQGFTHPLWCLLLVLGNLIYPDVYLTSLGLSVLCTLLALFIIFSVPTRTVGEICCGATLLFCSKAFVDFSTSGLETPLGYLLCAAFSRVFFSSSSSRLLLLRLYTIGSLLALTRHDLLLLLAPALLTATAYGLGQGALTLRQIIYSALLGSIPLFGWSLFSLGYYGFLWPNTAYAKLNTGVSHADLVNQAIHYFANSLKFDPSTLSAVVALPILGRSWQAWRLATLALGTWLYLFYVGAIGGDFMSGRYFAVPLFLTVAAFLHSAPSRPRAILACGVALSLASSQLLQAYDAAVNSDELVPSPMRGEFGISDERAVYYPQTGLLRRVRAPDDLPWKHPWWPANVDPKCAARSVRLVGQAGYGAFFDGPCIHHLDWNALADPLLARLPAASWTIGHFGRRIPHGYCASLKYKQNLLQDQDLALYYDKLVEIISGPIFSLSRLDQILKFNLLYSQPLLASYLSHQRNMPIVSAAIVPQRAPSERPIDSECPLEIYKAGVRIQLSSIVKASRIELSTDPDCNYTLELLKLGEKVLSTKIDAQLPNSGHYTIHCVPLTIVEPLEFDSIAVHHAPDDRNCRIGHLRTDCSLSTVALVSPTNAQ